VYRSQHSSEPRSSFADLKPVWQMTNDGWTHCFFSHRTVFEPAAHVHVVHLSASHVSPSKWPAPSHGSHRFSSTHALLLLLNTCPVGHEHVSVGKLLQGVSPDRSDL